MLIFLVLVPVVVAVYVLRQRRRGQRAAGLAAQGLVTTGAGRRPGPSRHLQFGLFATALALLVVALARPTATIPTLQHRATVILTLDVSNSMAATDVKPSRIAAAKAAADAFVDQQPSGVRMGVVAFGQRSVIVQRPTSSHAAVLQAVNRLSLGGGTSVAQGILTSLDAIAGKTLKINEQALSSDSALVHVGYYGGATIVLLSDGENTSQPDPQSAARLTSVAGVRIQTVGVGTAAGTTVQIQGFDIATALNSQTLRSMAAVTNGSYHHAGSAAGLRAISKTISPHLTVVHSHTEITALFAAAAVVLLVIGSLFLVLRSGRVM
ncbi:MAG TPA: VWA domain-containing protein [Acidimicrobiales bacterium]|nr:VWA domain-containing protein [Acidimicrobiales bacterium]